MKGFAGVGPLIWQRFRASWRLLAVLAFGMLVSATLLATSPVYTRVMNDLGLETSLNARIGNAGRNTAIQIDQPFGSPEAASEAQALTGILSDEVGWFTGSEVRYGSLTYQTFSLEGEEPRTDQLRPLVLLQSISDYEDHVRLTEGRLPEATDNPNAIEVLITANGARIFKLQAGDHFVASSPYNNCVPPPTAASAEEARDNARFRCVPTESLTLGGVFTVAGIVEQTDPDSVYWSSGRTSFATPVESETQGPVLQVLLPEQSYFGALPSLFPRIPSLFQISSLADVDSLDSADLPAAQASTVALRERLTERGALTDSPMANALATFEQRSTFNQVTLLLLLLQVVGIAVYYVLLVSSLLLERRSEEIAMLRSRGASVGQVVGLSAAEAALLALAVALLAPFLASGLVACLGLTGTFDSISGGGFLPFTLVPSSFFYGLAGALIAAFAVIVPAYFTARRGMVAFLRGHARPGASFVQRYYLDLILAGLAALALWQVNQRGSVFDPNSVGGWSADPLLLLSPLLLIVAIGTLLFRLLPPLLGVVGKLVARAGGPAVTLGLWQLNRSPSRYIQLALLVVMAAAVGTFAATYGDTTERSQQERVLFAAGVDVRTTNLGRLDRYYPEKIEQEFGDIDGVEQVSTAYRDLFGLGPLATGGGQVNLLAIDPEVAASQLWFRDDFSNEDLDTLLRRLRSSPLEQHGLPLGAAAGLSLWVNPSEPRETSTLWLRLQNADGSYALVQMGKLDFSGWQQMTVDFGASVDEPTLLAIYVTQPGRVQDLSRGSLTLDDITVFDASGVQTVIEDFERPLRWDLFRTPTQKRDRIEQVSQGAHSGDGALSYFFDSGTASALRGIFIGDSAIPLPAIASSSFMAAYGLQVGSVVELVFGDLLMPVSIQGQVDYFPTMDAYTPQFLIVNQDQFFAFGHLTNRTSDTTPTEAWLTLTQDPALRAEALDALGARWGIDRFELVDSGALLAEANSDPIVRAGGSGVLLIALLAAFAVLALGFALTLYLGGQARSLEISVLRALGLSSRQVFVMICIEYLVIAAIGLAVGTLAGLRISRTMLDFLNVTDEGDRLLPPFALTTSWDTVAWAFAATAAAFVAGVAALAAYFLRLPLARMLRITR